MKAKKVKEQLEEIKEKISNIKENSRFRVRFLLIRVPTRTGKMGRHFPVREKSGNFEQTGKVWENHTKYWKTEINIV